MYWTACLKIINAPTIWKVYTINFIPDKTQDETSIPLLNFIEIGYNATLNVLILVYR